MMKTIDMRFDSNIFKQMIGQTFKKYRSDEFVFNNSVTGIIGIFVDEKVYEFRNEQKSVDYLDFSDVENLSVVESILLEHAVASEIIGGYPDGTFKPENNLTRAEASKILSVYMNK